MLEKYISFIGNLNTVKTVINGQFNDNKQM